MLKKRVICLRPTCPYLLEPSSSFKKYCDYLVLATIIVQSLVLPYLCFFFKRLNAVKDGWLYMLDVIFIFGLYLEMSTAVKTHKKTLMKVSEIFIYKSKLFTTWVDIFSTIALEMVASLMGLDSRSMNLFRLNRVLRVYKVFWLIQRAELNVWICYIRIRLKVFWLIQRAELNVWICYIRIRLAKYFLLFSYSIYFASCVVYGTTCFWKCSRYGWMFTAIYSFIYPQLAFGNAVVTDGCPITPLFTL
ncbi:hypothetical protein QE152_g34229 [Popillia japonica]|uniref:Ion transport domain-containing protein n=1 Tax=Popillia japonica TaxID=7064 RepID=A0AAW1ITS8_POPJA